MASITITIPDAQLTRVTTALCTRAGVPVTNANAKQAVINQVMNIVKVYEAQIAARAAYQTSTTDVTTNIVLS